MIIRATQLFAFIGVKGQVSTVYLSQVFMIPLVLSILTKENSFPFIREISLITMLRWTHQI